MASIQQFGRQEREMELVCSSMREVPGPGAYDQPEGTAVAVSFTREQRDAHAEIRHKKQVPGPGTACSLPG
jgi:hypothetical protein